MHMNDFKFVCDECGFVGKSKSSLSSHKRAHKNKWIGIKCEICGRLCKNEFGYNRHKQNKHDPTIRKKISQASIDRFKDKDFRLLHSHNTKSGMDNPIVKSKCGEKSKAVIFEKRKDPEYEALYKSHVSYRSKISWEKKTDAERAKVVNKILRGRSRKIIPSASKYADDYVDSSYEKRFVELLDKDVNVLYVSRCNFSIKYVFDKKRKTYIPDFKVVLTNGAVCIVEIKSNFTIADCKVPYKASAAFDFCKKANWMFFLLADDELKTYEMILRRQLCTKTH